MGMLSTSYPTSYFLPLTSHAFHKHYLVISRTIELRDRRRGPIAPGLVERARGGIVGAAGGLDNDQPRRACQSSLHLADESSSDSGALHRGIDRHPVEVVGAEGAGSRSPADPARKPAIHIGTDRHIGRVGRR